MIPSDLAARLRFLHEASLFETAPPVAGLQRGREVQAQLQELLPGQRFLATLQRTLPDGTFRAMVAGQQVTLSLNASAKPGDTLELVATKVTPQMVLSQLATEGASSARPTLSQTGQLISFLLTGQPAAKPAELAGNQPLLPASPSSTGNVATSTAANIGAQLAPLLRQALSQSGLFYEAHQAQWLAGKIDLETLMREPQGQSRPPGTPPPPGQLPSQTSGQVSSQASGQAPSQTGQAASSGNVPARAAISAVHEPAREPIARLNSATSQLAENVPRPVSDRLLPVVHQQLEALASQQYVWHGMAWPGQVFEWIIEDPRDEGHAEDEEADGQWNTTLRLSLPRLGGVEARIQLGAQGVALRLNVEDMSAAARLEGRREELAQALEAAGVPLTGMVVEHGDES